MGFAEEFRELDPTTIEKAYANVSERLFIIAAGGGEFASLTADLFRDVEEASPGFMALISRHEEAIQMASETPGVRYGHEWFNLIQMNLGMLSVGLVLAEYARLEREAD